MEDIGTLKENHGGPPSITNQQFPAVGMIKHREQPEHEEAHTVNISY